MIFRTITDDLTGANKSIGLFGLSLNDVSNVLNNIKTNGLKNAIFNTSTLDIEAISTYNREIAKGATAQEALATASRNTNRATIALMESANGTTISTEQMTAAQEASTLAAKAQSAAYKAVSIALNMLVMWAAIEAIKLISIAIDNLDDSLKEVEERIESNQNTLSEYTSKVEELTAKLEELNNTNVTYFSDAERQELETEKEYIQSEIDLYNQLIEAKQKAVNEDSIKAVMGENEKNIVKKIFSEIKDGDWEEANELVNMLHIPETMLPNTIFTGSSTLPITSLFQNVDDGNYLSEADKLLAEYEQLQNKYIALQNLAIENGNNESLAKSVDETSSEMNQVAADIAEYIEQIAEARDALANSVNSEDYIEEIAKMDEAIKKYQDILNGTIYESKYAGYTDLQRDLLGIRDAINVIAQSEGLEDSVLLKGITEYINRIIDAITIFSTFSPSELFEMFKIGLKNFNLSAEIQKTLSGIRELLPPEIIENWEKFSSSIAQVTSKLKKLGELVVYLGNKSGITELSTSLKTNAQTALSPLIDFIDKYITLFGQVKNAWDDAHELKYSSSNQINSKTTDKNSQKTNETSNNKPSNLFLETLNAADYADIKAELLDLAQSGELTPETLSSTEEYNALLAATKTSAESAANEILDMLSAQEKLAAASQGLDHLKTAYEEFKNSGFVTAETLSSLPDVFKNLPGYDLFSQIVGDPTSGSDAIQQAFNDICKSYLLSQDTLSGLVNANEHEIQSYIANLRQMGVTNAEEFVNQAITALSQENALLNAAEEEYITYLNNKSAYDAEYLTNLSSKNGQLVQALGSAYQSDYNNWCDLLSKKAEAYNELITAIGGSYNSNLDVANNLIQNNNSNPSSWDIAAGEAAKSKYDQAVADANKLKEALNFDLSTISTSLGTSFSPTSNSGSGSDSSASEANIETFDWIETAVTREEEALNRLDKTVGNTYDLWSSRNNALNQEIEKSNAAISLQQSAFDAYMAKANSVGLSQDYIQKIQNGTLQIEDIADENLQDKISQYQDWYEKAMACADAITELNISLGDLAQQKFDNLQTEYESFISVITAYADIIDERINRTKEHGYFVDKSYYEQLIQYEQQELANLKNQYAALENALHSAVTSGAIKEGSEAWNSMYSELLCVKKEIEASTTSLVEFSNTIRDINWEIFDYLEDRINQITQESDFLIDLLDNETLYGETGNFNSQGMAAAALHGINYNTYLQQALDYAQEMKKIEAELASDPNSQTLIERREELLELQQDAITNAEAEKDAIKSLVEEGIEIHLNALSDLIDKYKESLNAAKDLYDYQKNISEQTQNIANLEKIIMAYQGDDSEEARKTIQDTQNQLNEAKSELQETQWENYISETETLLDSLYDEYEETLNARLDNIDVLVSDMIDMINGNGSEIKEAITATADKFGYDLSAVMDSVFGTGGTNTTILSSFMEKFATTSTTLQASIDAIKNMVNSMAAASKIAVENEASSGVSGSTGTGTSSQASSQSQSASTPVSTNTGGDGKASIGDAVTFISGKYHEDSWGNGKSGSQCLKGTVYITKISPNSPYPYHISRTAKFGEHNLGWVKLSQLSGYQTGSRSIRNAQWAWTQENGMELLYDASSGAMLTPLGQGDKVFTNEMSERLWQIAQGNLIPKLPNMTAARNTGIVNNDNQISITLPNVSDYNTFKQQLQADHKFVGFMQEVTLGQALGNGKLNRKKY